MTKRTKSDLPGMPPLGVRLIEAAQEAAAFARGEASAAVIHHPPPEVDVKAVRMRQGLTQSQFAGRYGFTLGAVRDWEQKRRRPEGAARVLLRVIDLNPDVVERALKQP